MAKKTTQSPPKSFEDAVAELEKILSDIEAGQLGLEETLTRYERGNFLIAHCREVLGAAEKQIELISKGPDGTLTAQPLEPRSSGAAEEV